MQRTTSVHVGKERANQDGYVTNIDFLELLGLEQRRFMENTVGVAFEEIEGRWGLRLLVTALQVTYYFNGFARQVRAGDDLSINTGVESMDVTSFTFAQTTRRREDVICNATLTLVFIDQEGKSAPIPDELRKLLVLSP